MMTYPNANLVNINNADRASQTADNNRLNFKKGDPISQILKGITSFSLDELDQCAVLNIGMIVLMKKEPDDLKFLTIQDNQHYLNFMVLKLWKHMYIKIFT